MPNFVCRYAIFSQAQSQLKCFRILNTVRSSIIVQLHINFNFIAEFLRRALIIYLHYVHTILNTILLNNNVNL